MRPVFEARVETKAMVFAVRREGGLDVLPRVVRDGDVLTALAAAHVDLEVAAAIRGEREKVAVRRPARPLGAAGRRRDAGEPRNRQRWRGGRPTREAPGRERRDHRRGERRRRESPEALSPRGSGGRSAESGFARRPQRGRVDRESGPRPCRAVAAADLSPGSDGGVRARAPVSAGACDQSGSRVSTAASTSLTVSPSKGRRPVSIS